MTSVSALVWLSGFDVTIVGEQQPSVVGRDSPVTGLVRALAGVLDRAFAQQAHRTEDPRAYPANADAEGPRINGRTISPSTPARLSPRPARYSGYLVEAFPGNSDLQWAPCIRSIRGKAVRDASDTALGEVCTNAQTVVHDSHN